jgi:hypothetical protein
VGIRNVLAKLTEVENARPHSSTYLPPNGRNR